MMNLDEKVWIKWRRGGDRKGLWVVREDINVLDSQSRERERERERERRRGVCVEMGGKNVCE